MDLRKIEYKTLDALKNQTIAKAVDGWCNKLLLKEIYEKEEKDGRERE